MERYQDKLITFLRGAPLKIHVVTMPDFFLDRIISLDCSPYVFSSYAIDKSGRKVNMAFNAETLKRVRNPEAGEH